MKFLVCCLLLTSFIILQLSSSSVLCWTYPVWTLRETCVVVPWPHALVPMKPTHLKGLRNADGATRAGLGQAVFRLYRRNSGVETSSGNNISFSRFDPHLPVKVIIHGWKGYGNDPALMGLVKAYLSVGDCNVFTVDWSGAGSLSIHYTTARNSVPNVGQQVAMFLDNLVAQKHADLRNVHVLGFSLGAHIAGIAGYYVRSGKIPRVTGIDPAGPLFSLQDKRSRLSTDSASFVDVIHTNPAKLGIESPIGHADFYPNGPTKAQPGCIVDLTGLCSHMRGLKLYAESIVKPRAFLAASCPSWQHFLSRACNLNSATLMGEAVSPSARGIYSVVTNALPPFGMGSA